MFSSKQTVTSFRSFHDSPADFRPSSNGVDVHDGCPGKTRLALSPRATFCCVFHGLVTELQWSSWPWGHSQYPPGPGQAAIVTILPSPFGKDAIGFCRRQASSCLCWVALSTCTPVLLPWGKQESSPRRKTMLSVYPVHSHGISHSLCIVGVFW